MRLVTDEGRLLHHLRASCRCRSASATLEAMTLRNQPIGKNLLAVLPAAGDLGLAVVAVLRRLARADIVAPSRPRQPTAS